MATVHLLPLLGGNIGSIQRAIELTGANVVLVTSPETLYSATHLILPGIGHFDSAMEFLMAKGFDRVIIEQTKNHELKILGICLGMQLLGKGSEEGKLPGLNLIPIAFESLKNAPPLRSLHNGWNTLTNLNHPLLEGITSNDYFYFLHQYAAPVNEFTIASSQYGVHFSAAIAHQNCFGVQFHPEKSHDAGLRILHHFIQL